MKIKKILLYNFKNFRHETFVDFSDNITFLVGPNGFGKTTIFDAIELGLTGNISRITQATQVTGENVAYNKPFFQNDISEPVIVKLWLEKSNGEQLVIIRKFINDNPNGGKVFAPKKSIKQFKLSQQEEVTDDNFKSIDIDNIRSSLIQQTVIDEFLDINGKYEIDTIFNLFNYIQQEETTFFLKKTEKDRSNNLSFLVKTDEIEDKISKIDKITRAIKGELRSLTKKQEKFTQQELDDTPYQRMFNQQVFQFDKERPFSTENLNQLDNFKTKVQKIIEFKQNFSISEYRRKLERDEQKKEIGASDSVLRFSILFPLIKRPNDQWRWEKYALENPILFEYVLLENYLQSFETIISENERRKQLNNYLTNLSPDITQMTAHSFQYVPNDNFSNDFELLKSQWTHYQALREGAGELDKNLSDLRRLRNNLDSKFSELKHQHVDENKCPFCSKQFDSYDDLKQAYESYETYLSEISSGNSQRLQEIQLSLNLLIQQVKQKITDEINRISTNVDEKLVAKLQELRSLYQGNSRNINGFKTFIESYTNISPFQLGSLTFDVYNQQYQSKLQEFRSKLVADAEIYSSLDISNLENIERQFDELRTEFPELQLETYQLRPNSGSKISSSTIDSLLSEIKILIRQSILGMESMRI